MGWFTNHYFLFIEPTKGALVLNLHEIGSEEKNNTTAD